MGQLVKAGLLRPLDRLRERLRLEGPLLAAAAGPQQVLVRRQGRSAPATSTALSQMGEIVGVFYNKEKVPTPSRRRSTSSSSSCRRPSRRATCRSSSATSTSRPGIHEFESVLGQIADKQAIRDFVFAKEGANFDQPEFTDAATKLTDWVKKGYFTPELQRRRLRPRVAAVRQGQGHVPDRRHVGDGRPRRQDGRQGRLHADARAQDAAQPVSLGGESLPFAITSKSKNPDVAAAYIDFITNANAAKVLAETNNLPAMKGDADAGRAGCPPTSSTAWEEAQRGRRR